jgi:5'-AMP-activated protein kinase catalytic alpha subunit
MSGINCVFFDGRWLKVVKGMKYFLQKFGVKEQEVHSALLSGDPHDQLAIAYHLIIDNKRIADEAAKAELKDFYVASSPPPISFSPSELNPSPIRPHPERIARKLYL